MRIAILLSFCLAAVSTFCYGNIPPALELPSIFDAGSVSAVIVFTKVNHKRVITLSQGRTVWIVTNKKRNGRLAFKRSRISKIENHKITFTPFNSNFEEVTIPDSLLAVIAYQNAGSVIRGVVVNLVMVTVVVVIVFAEVLLAIFTADSSWLGDDWPDFADFPWDGFVNRIKIFTRNGNRRWQVEAIEAGSPRIAHLPVLR
jgi:hypothetical protein